jgi:ectoine hydroxylase-related dioxygenase (phytanoyl-CoA dioxygenase family)
MACWLATRALEADNPATVVTGSHTLEDMKEDMHRSMQLGNFDEESERDVS